MCYIIALFLYKLLEKELKKLLTEKLMLQVYFYISLSAYYSLS